MQKLYVPFWNQACQELSRQLLLPTVTGSEEWIIETLQNTSTNWCGEQ
ncbi:hypothetical protein VU04_04600 [Desulfobulbus sp. TB]|nr:hypothetical protein [Desulfobulbus sp. TB]